MKKQKIKIYCSETYCEEYKIIEWEGEYLSKFWCKKHAYKRYGYKKENEISKGRPKKNG